MSINWTLFVDETGDFRKQNDEVCVLGLLIRDDAQDEESWSGLKDTLQRLAWELPWPFHAAYYNGFATFWALSSFAKRNPPRGAPAALKKRDHDANTAVYILRNHLAQRPAVKTVLDAFHSGTWDRPRIYETLGRLDGQLNRWCSHNGSPIFDRLKRRRRDLWEHLRIALHNLSVRRGDSSGLGVMAFSASEAQLASAWNSALKPVDYAASERYLALLRAVFERTCRVLDRDGRWRQGQGSPQPHRHVISLQVLQRDVFDPTAAGGRGTRVPLSQREVAKQATTSCPGTGFAAFAFPAQLPTYRGPTVHPALVLADFAANKSYPQFRTGSLAKVEGRLHLQLGKTVWVRTGAPPRTHVAACPHSNHPSYRRWAKQQYKEWL